MKKILSLALVLVMAMGLLTACGVELKAPDGVYSTESGTYKAVFSNYDAKENVGDLSITFTIIDTSTTVSGKFSVAVMSEEDNTFYIDFTPDGATEPIESFGGYMANDNAFVQLEGLEELGGQSGISYTFGDPTAEE